MKQRHRRIYIQKKQLTSYMKFLIKTGKHKYDPAFSQPPLVPFIRSFRLGIFPNLIEIQNDRYGINGFLK